MKIIRKRDTALQHANLRDYDAVCGSFTWDIARRELDGLPGGGLNIAYEAVDRHVVAGQGDRAALIWLGKDGGRQDFTYGALAAQSNRFANVLEGLGLQRGEAVFGLMGRRPELYLAALATWKTGNVFSPLFSAFGPEPLKARMGIGRARALVTTDTLYRRKVEPLRGDLPELHHVLLLRTTDQPLPPDTVDLALALADAVEDFTCAPTQPGCGAPPPPREHG